MTSKNFAKELNIFLILFFGLSLIIYIISNGGAFWQLVSYRFSLASAGSSLSLPVLPPAAQSNTAGPVEVEEEDFTLIIPKIKVKAPIVRAEENTPESILLSLERGVGIYPTSAGIGKKGRSVILGHSSLASWYKGNYAYVFSLLAKLRPGDKFYVTAPGKRYTYLVLSNRNLPPKEADQFLSIPTQKSELDLITCYPVGSASQRTIVRAQLISSETFTNLN